MRIYCDTKNSLTLYWAVTMGIFYGGGGGMKNHISA